MVTPKKNALEEIMAAKMKAEVLQFRKQLGLAYGTYG